MVGEWVQFSGAERPPIVDQRSVPGNSETQAQDSGTGTTTSPANNQESGARMMDTGSSRPTANAANHLTNSASPSGSTTSSDTGNAPVMFRTTPPFPSFPMPFMGQIPHIPRFTGEGRGTGDSFALWHEHFENVARLVGWDDHWKLVHLTSNLHDTAMAFYRSCSADVRSKYPALVAAMKQRFTPIRLTAVQAKLFHTRQQLENETVDQFAQELRKLYNLAYAGAASEGPHAERMGQTLLANQFVTGLQPHLKRKLIGVEGGLDELILKARFEEANSQELTTQKIRNPTPARRPQPPPGPTTTSSPAATSAPVTPVETTTTGSGERGHAVPVLQLWHGRPPSTYLSLRTQRST